MVLFLFVSRQSKLRYVGNLESSAFHQNMYLKSLLCEKTRRETLNKRFSRRSKRKDRIY